jgi:phenylalanyl-tRNA synthetase beta subunit
MTNRYPDTQKPLAPAERHRALSILHGLLAAHRKNKYRKVADQIGFSYSFVNQVAHEKLLPSRPMLKALLNHIPAPPNTTVSVRMKNMDDKAWVLENISNNERAENLISERNE